MIDKYLLVLIRDLTIRKQRDYPVENGG